MENYGASWPHLTAELEDMQAVWDDFMIQVNTTELENHDHDHGHDHSGEGTHSDEHEEPTVMVALPSGDIYSENVELNGFDQLTASAYKNGWTVNSSSSQWGTFVSGIMQMMLLLITPGGGNYTLGILQVKHGRLQWLELILSKQEILHSPNSTDDTAIPAPQETMLHSRSCSLMVRLKYL